jgi:hypothetical protein
MATQLACCGLLAAVLQQYGMKIHCLFVQLSGCAASLHHLLAGMVACCAQSPVGRPTRGPADTEQHDCLHQ